MSDTQKAKSSQEIAKIIAEQHVTWLLELLKPLLITHMVHGFKHGQDFAELMEKYRHHRKQEVT